METTFIGLGTMGRPMVANLVRAGVTEVSVHDADPATLAEVAAATGARPLAEAARAADSDVVILMLPDAGVVRAVLGDPADPGSLAARLAPGALVVDMGSSAPRSTAALAAALRERDVGLVDAPVSGGPRKAATAELTIMLGGADEDCARVEPLLLAMGGPPTRTGPVGSAHALKALNNLLSAIGLVGALEVLTVGKDFGLDPAVMLDVINRSTGRNQSTEVKIGPQVLGGGFDVGFSLALTVKDIGTALDLARAQGIDSPLAETCVRVCREALDSLRGTEPDQSEVVRHLERRSGVRLTPEPG
ncbi:NAD(P)-dependent oxidoreductase [Saccharopolyspora cebuensis]|uniref:NAD(P)-dependent oxidoreductase n=1 Tax=Saccharopolyspora cebuensis TaxID=418759 RepID=A0ABV4CK40_9PSEU